ncbi:MAG: PQQ-dependent dehydrogenase, methanol/ethanol family [Gammaproteobacteria bacterium]
MKRDDRSRRATTITTALLIQAAFAGAPATAQLAVTDEMLLEAGKDPNNWLMVGRDYAGTRYTPLTQVNKDNIGRLVPKWTFSFGVLDAQNTTPIVNDGIMYATASHGLTFAIDARTGREIWRYAHAVEEGVAGVMCCDIGNRGVALYGDKVFVATPDAHVVALDYKTGEVQWDVTVGKWEDAVTMTVAPLVVKGKVIVGLSGAEYPTRLYIEALDTETGEQVWRRYTIPGPGEPGHDTWGTTDAAMHGGASAWITGSYDPELDTLYWGVGNPNPDWDGTNRPGDNLYSNSTLAMNPDTGEIKFHFQYTPHDVWDFDGNNETVLLDVASRKVWLHGDRNGFLYSIDRTNGEFVYGVPISKVNWATGLTSEGRPIVNEEKVPTYEYEAKDICPASEGGKWWNPMTVNPHTAMVFVPSREICTDIQSAPLGEGTNPAERTIGKPYWGIGTIKWNQGHGQLVAFNAETGEKSWVVKAPSPFTSGLMSTGGGLIFAGTPEGEFKAYNEKTGEELWSYNTGSGIFGSPMSFVVDGKQYVAVPSGFGGWTGWATIGGGGAPQLKNSRKGGYLTVFGLFEE